MGFFKNFFRGFSKIDDEFYEELEEVMVMGDIGIHATEELIDTLKDQVKENRIKEPEGCRTLLMESVREMMQTDPEAYAFEDMTSAILVIGVNGVGKTTTIGKLAAKIQIPGKTCRTRRC